jgi:hypothetical protein
VITPIQSGGSFKADPTVGGIATLAIGGVGNIGMGEALPFEVYLAPRGNLIFNVGASNNSPLSSDCSVSLVGDRVR